MGVPVPVIRGAPEQTASFYYFNIYACPLALNSLRPSKSTEQKNNLWQFHHELNKLDS